MDNENRGNTSGYSSSVMMISCRAFPAVFCLLFTIQRLCQSIERQQRSGLFDFGFLIWFLKLATALVRSESWQF